MKKTMSTYEMIVLYLICGPTAIAINIISFWDVWFGAGSYSWNVWLVAIGIAVLMLFFAFAAVAILTYLLFPKFFKE